MYCKDHIKGQKHTVGTLEGDKGVVECVRNIASFICNIIKCLVVVLIAILIFKHGGTLFVGVDRILNVFYDMLLEICDFLWGSVCMVARFLSGR